MKIIEHWEKDGRLFQDGPRETHLRFPEKYYNKIIEGGRTYYVPKNNLKKRFEVVEERNVKEDNPDIPDWIILR